VLRQAGFKVHDAGDGGEALRLVTDLNPDIVLLDVHLPDVSGLEVCRRIKAQDQNAGVIVVQISASAISAPQATSALNCGADSYLIEPVDPDVLVATIRAFLRLRAAERELAKANAELSQKNGELRQLNDALKSSNEDLEHFAYVASHDLQEPLRNITTHLQLLERQVASRLSESEGHLFTVVVNSARRMTTLIQDVLAYAGLGRETPKLQSTPLDDALKAALENLSQGMRSSGAVLHAEPLPVVTGDLVQLSRVFQNLIGNSIKYRKPGVLLRIDITVQKDTSNCWLFGVHDNGIGIEQHQLERIFQPFKRLHGQQIPGTGIGLALCRRIIEAHGGRIWADSRVGEGSNFCFTLPSA
jgi:two-component system sensor histidine kinase/response regulator